MRSPYLCAYHAERLKACESEAFRYWGEMMRRGVQAYVECRFDAAVLYLGTALEIGLLRQRCQLNGLFAGVHIQKPVEFLVELLKIDRQYQQVNELLDYVSKQVDSVAKQADSVADITLANFLNRSFIVVNNASANLQNIPYATGVLNVSSALH